MPTRISQLIETHDQTSKNRLENVLTILKTLLNNSKKTESAVLCTISTAQIHRLEGEGQHFCGYRNMQMLLSSLPEPLDPISRRPPSHRSTGACTLTQQKPTVLALQALIEKAWSAGHNAHGRIETDGILNTRKHVGTSEAEALFAYLDVETTAHVFRGAKAWRNLLDYVEQYFSESKTAVESRSKTGTAGRERITLTARPPMFLQRPRHSLTIVGIECTRSGKRRLLVFDPGYDPPATLKRALGRADYKIEEGKEERVLTYYRRGERYLKRFDGFEILHVKG